MGLQRVSPLKFFDQTLYVFIMFSICATDPDHLSPVNFAVLFVP
jgi:hypothetical protein